MNRTMRLALAILTTLLVTAAGAVILEPLGLGSFGWLALLLLAMVAGSLVDREHFYGPRSPHTHA